MDAGRPGAIIIEGHVQGLANTRAFGQEGIPVIVVDKSDCIVRYSKYCTGFFKCPDFIDDRFADFLLDLAEKNNLQDWLLLPSNDHAVYTIAKHRKRLSAHFRIITPALGIIEKIYDKSRLLELAMSLGLPVPAMQYVVSNVQGIIDLRFPVLIKGKRGLSFYKRVGKKAVIAKDRNELYHSLRKLAKSVPLEETFTQEVIPFDGSNKTISFTAFCVDGEIKTFWMGVKLREHPLRFGTATFCESVYQQECLDQSIPLLRGLKYTGVCEIEYLCDPRDGEFKLIEMNARTWLWVGLAIACGVNYPSILYSYLHDIAVNYPSKYSVGLRWRNYWPDLLFSTAALFSHQLSLREYWASIMKNDAVDAVKDREDPDPFKAMTKMLFRLARNR
jgi:D-aspartate ligase